MEHVIRRGGRYFWRARVPADLVARIGRQEIVRSLQTSSPGLARGRAASFHLAFMLAWESIRQMEQADLDTRDELIAILEASLETAIANIAVLEASNETQLRIAATRLEKTKADRSRMHLEFVQKADYKFREIAEDIKRIDAIVQASNISADHLDRIQKILATTGASYKLTVTPKILEFMNSTYILERELNEDASRHVQGYVKLFVKISGNRQFSDYTRNDIVTWVRTLEKMKSSHGKSDKDDPKTINELIRESNGKRTLSVTTIKKHITHLKAMFISANRHKKFTDGDDVEGLFADIRLGKSVPVARPRKTWTVAQLNQLIGSPIWTGTRSLVNELTRRHEPGPQIHRDSYWWMPIVALWTGARLEEIAQLHHADLHYDSNDVPYVQIFNEGGRSVKNKNSIRNVPIHSFLIKIGFLELFVSRAKGRIWPELVRHGRPPKWGGLYSSHFTDYRRACGLYEELRDFHSLRRTFISTMRNKSKVDPLTVAAIVGHDDSEPELRRVKQTNDYTDYEIETLRDAIERLDYAASGVDLSIILRTAEVSKPRSSLRFGHLARGDA